MSKHNNMITLFLGLIPFALLSFIVITVLFSSTTFRGPGNVALLLIIYLALGYGVSHKKIWGQLIGLIIAIVIINMLLDPNLHKMDYYCQGDYACIKDLCRRDLTILVVYYVSLIILNNTINFRSRIKKKMIQTDN